MSTDIKDISDTVEEVAFGAAETAARVASDPVGAVRKQVKGLERKGTPTARRVNRRLGARFNTATAPARQAVKDFTKAAEQFAGDLNPEKAAIRGLRLVKVQARRPDMVGDVAKGTLRIINRSLKAVARLASRLEGASELTPAKPAAVRRPARRRTSGRAA
jgi:hypothetical protein